MFPCSEEHVTEEPLTAKLSRSVMIWDVVEIERFVSQPMGCWRGRPLCDRRSLARAFVAKAVYDLPTTAERGNSRLKDEFGLRHLRVRGHPKVHMHIMFGILVLFADQIMKPIRG